MKKLSYEAPVAEALIITMEKTILSGQEKSLSFELDDYYEETA